MKIQLNRTNLKQKLRFTLIELVLAMVIITISFLGVTTITSVGIDAGGNAISESITTDVADQFLRYNAGMVKKDEDWLEMFPNSPAEGDDSLMDDETILTWSNTTFLENESMKIRFVTTNPDAPFDPDAHRVHRDERSVFLYEQLAREYSKYSVSIRPWKEKKDLGNGSWEATLFVEVSYPASMPYPQRLKKVYSVNLFKAPEIALATSP